MDLKKIITKALLCIIWCHMFFGYHFTYSLGTQDISDPIFSLDAQDIDNDSNIANDPSTWSLVESIVDNFSTHTGSQDDTAQQPLFEIGAINDQHPGIKFDGSNDIINIQDHIDITVGPTYSEKSYALVLKTSTDITSLQTIYDEGTKEKWFSFQIKDSHLYAGAYNSLDWASGKEFRTIDLWVIETEKEYIVIFVYDSTTGEVRWYLNGVLQWTLSDSGPQVTHGACIFTAFFNCAMYSVEWTIGLWAIKNHWIDLSNNTQITSFEAHFFNGYIWEINSWNHALSSSEVDDINIFLLVKWWFDSTPPVVDSNTSSWAIVPIGTFDIDYTYSDSHTWALGIDVSSIDLELNRWDSWAFGTGNIITNHRNDTLTNETGSWATYTLENLTLGKYRLIFEISDFWGNTQTNEIVFYRDAPELIVGSWSIDMWILSSDFNIFSPEINVTVKTIGAPFHLIMNLDQDLSYGITTIDSWNGSEGFGFDQEVFTNSISAIASPQIIWTGSLSPNNDGLLNEYIYRIKFGWQVNPGQEAGDYVGDVSFWIDLQYNR